jgi:arylsulfatase A-like enzyme
LAWLAQACSESRAPAPVAAAPECAPRPESAASERPNVVLVVLGSTRYSHTGFGNYPRPTTPFLDALAARGLQFPLAHAAAPDTFGSLAALMSGWPGHGAGGSEAAPNALRAGASAPVESSLARCFADGGYARFGRSADAELVAAPWALAFDDFAADPDLSAAGAMDELARWLARAAREGVATEAGRPFFALLHLGDASFPYLPRPEYYRAFERRGDAGIARDAYPEVARDALEAIAARVRGGEEISLDDYNFTSDLYDAELRQQDDALAVLPDLLRVARVAQRTLVVVTADHGERLLEKRDLGHGGALDYRTLHVPLVLAGPGIPRGERDARVARSFDLYATFAARAGLRPLRELPSRDLLAPPGDGADGGFPGSAFARSGREEMARSGRFAFYRRSDARSELYDLERDPQERYDLAARRPETVRWLDAELARWRTALHAPAKIASAVRIDAPEPR